MPAPICFALALALAPQEWTALEMPRLCVERPAAPWMPALNDGRHVLVDGLDNPRRPEPSAELSAAQLAQMLEAEARRRGRTIAVYAASSPLLVQGSEEDVAWARAFVASLDASAARLSIDLEAVLAPGRETPARGDEVQAPDAAAGGGAWRASMRSGDEVAFGEREHRRFVASFDVEVAHNSGVAAPVVGSVLTGPTVHLRAARVDAGKRVHVEGLLDLSELERVEEFHPETADLGLVEEPVVSLIQVTFSGVVESGGELVVEVRGAPLSRPDWTLRVRASTTADPAPDADAWRLADLAFLAAPPRSLGEFSFGTGLDPLARLDALGGTAAAITPSALYLSADSQRRANARGVGAGSGAWTERAVLVAPDERASWDELERLVRAMEAPRVRTANLRLESGGWSVALPVAAGEAARVITGTERTWLVDYDTQIAPDTWMPAPRVERAFDGLAWQGRFDGGALESSAAQSRTSATEVVEKRAANMGGLQLPARSVRVGRERLGAGAEPRVLLQATTETPALLLRFAF